MIDNEDTPTVQRSTSASTEHNAAIQPAPSTTTQPATRQEASIDTHTSTANEQQEDPAATIQTEAVQDSDADEQEDAEQVNSPGDTSQGEEARESTASAATQPSTEQVSSTKDPIPYLNVEDLLSLEIVSEPQISPNGSWIAFTVQSCHAETNTTSSAIWLVSSQGGKKEPARQITAGNNHDSTPRWSPDGQTLAFLSNRTGTSQIYLLPLNGGEARQLSNLPQGISSYSWRPDGKLLLATSAWKPGDDKADPTDANELVYLYTRLDELQNGTGHLQGRHEQLWLIPLQGNAMRLTSEPVDLLQSSWSPDGTEIAFSANRRPLPDLSISKALWVLTVATGQMRRLTPEEGLAQEPAWSPDGQSIAYLYTPDQTEAGNVHPWVVAADGKSAPHPAVTGAEELACQEWIFDELRTEWLSRPQWYPDSKSFLVTAQTHGQVHLYRIELGNNKISQLTSGNGRYLSPQLSRNGQLLALIRADWFTPGDIWSMGSDGQGLRKLTRINDVFLQKHQLIRPKRISWHSIDGQEIEGWLYLPALPEGVKAPLILAPHGGPALAWGDGYVHEFQVLAGKGYAVLAPNPRGSTGYGEDFSRKILNDWGGIDFQDLMAGLDHVIATEAIDANRLGINGTSYGGYMTNWAITQTQRFKAAVSRNGLSSIATASLLSDQPVWLPLSMEDPALQQARSPLTFADRISTPLLLLHAEDDLACPFSESLQLFVALRKRKHPVELVRYRQASHLMDWPTVGMPQQRVDRLRRTLAWFERFL
ncbi:hypothetical protein EPA93_20120 [Ktedonosporobacter rubrisoli]|uniref:Peptidase S9 prolyl oligopeptidase catalytic domain-containing protein n=1 Tax=Ktedonosporobacter rubrisoli TaxID=2509675 RepID=A0A4P6JRR9_KTERU|nr:prolyl oligopeptidase family serine peptidase [Ktedonosporobacter rubrisoli]QBD78178.1 hypothetical protein EPA93_20120 [Ktedonosporobacter rubrisoli]